MRRLVCEYYDGFSFGQFMRQYPDLRGTVTDLLIGDLFHDRVDKVWEPLESLYPEGKTPPPSWDGGAPAESAPASRTNCFCPKVPCPECKREVPCWWRRATHAAPTARFKNDPHSRLCRA